MTSIVSFRSETTLPTNRNTFVRADQPSAQRTKFILHEIVAGTLDGDSTYDRDRSTEPFSIDRFETLIAQDDTYLGIAETIQPSSTTDLKRSVLTFCHAE
jgi:hypothetical protein